MSNVPRFAHAFLSPGVLTIAGLGILECLLQRISPTPLNGVWFAAAGVVVAPQFVGYIVVPVWLLYCVSRDGRTRMPEVLLRSGSYLHVWAASIVEASRVAGSGALTVLIGVLVAFIGLPPQSAPIRLLLNGATVSLSAPILVFGEFAVLLIVLPLLRSIFVAVGAVTGRRWPTVVLAIAVWIWIVASLTGAVGSDSAANASRYFALPSILAFGAWTPLATGVCLGFAGSAGALVALDRRLRQVALPVDPLRGGFVVVALAVAGLPAVVALPYARDFFGILNVALIGNGGTLLAALPAVIIGVGYGYVAQLSWASRGDQQRYAELLRHGSRARRAARLLRREAARAAGYLLATDAVAAGTALALGDHAGAMTEGFIAPWVFQLTVNGILVVWMNLVFLFVVTDLCESPLAGTIAGVVLVAAVIWPFHSAWYPFGAASPARAESGWPDVIAASASLCLTIAAALAFYFLVSSRPRRATA